MLNGGHMPFRELGLDAMMSRNHQVGRPSSTDDVTEAVERRDVVMIAVGTPKGEDREADLSSVRNAARLIAGDRREDRRDIRVHRRRRNGQ